MCCHLGSSEDHRNVTHLSPPLPLQCLWHPGCTPAQDTYRGCGSVHLLKGIQENWYKMQFIKSGSESLSCKQVEATGTTGETGVVLDPYLDLVLLLWHWLMVLESCWMAMAGWAGGSKAHFLPNWNFGMEEEWSLLSSPSGRDALTPGQALLAEGSPFHLSLPAFGSAQLLKHLAAKQAVNSAPACYFQGLKI